MIPIEARDIHIVRRLEVSISSREGRASKDVEEEKSVRPVDKSN